MTESAWAAAARRVEDICFAGGLRPDRIVQTADGGAMFYFFSRAVRYAAIECHDNGEIVLLIAHRRPGIQPYVRQLSSDEDIRQALVSIRGFVTDGQLNA